MDENSVDKILCPLCGINTNHEIVWKSKVNRQEDEENGFWAETSFDLLQCLGCETATLRRKDLFSEDLDIRTIRGKEVIVPKVTLWPKTSFRMLKLKYLSNAPPSVKRVYRETIEAYNSELSTLCAAGIRSIIEAVCHESGIEKGNLEDKINALKEIGLITQSLAEALHENRLLGNYALHRSALFGDTELKTAIELIESFIDMVYETKGRAKMIKVLREMQESRENNKSNSSNV